MSKEPTYRLADHLCRTCGGRILLQVTPPAKNAAGCVWRCADCGAQAADIFPHKLCWCGATWRGGESLNLLCSRIDEAKDDPALREALAQCGCGGEGYRFEIGIINLHAYREKSRENI